MVLLLDQDFLLKPQNPGDTMVQGRRHEHRQPPFQTPLSGEKKYLVRIQQQAQACASQILEFGRKKLPVLEFPLQFGCNNF